MFHKEAEHGGAPGSALQPQQDGSFLLGWHQCREEPKEEVAVVFFVDSEIPRITLDIGTWQISNQTEFPGFIYGALLQVRSEKERRPGVDSIEAADTVRFSA